MSQPNSQHVYNLLNMAYENTYFRRVIYTAEEQQLVIMALDAKGLPAERHSTADQMITVVSGRIQVTLNGVDVYPLGPGSCINVPAGTLHSVQTFSELVEYHDDFTRGGSDHSVREIWPKIWTIYSTPTHPAGENAQYNDEVPESVGGHHYGHGTSSAGNQKVHKVMKEYKQGHLHSGSKHGPVVHNRKQAIAIALSEARKTEGK